MNFFSNKPELLEILGEARQRREEERKRQEILNKKNLKIFYCNRMIREQQRQVSKVLLDGLYDPDSPLTIILGDHHVFMKEVWLELKENWQIFPDQ